MMHEKYLNKKVFVVKDCDCEYEHITGILVEIKKPDYINEFENFLCVEQDGKIETIAESEVMQFLPQEEFDNPDKLYYYVTLRC